MKIKTISVQALHGYINADITFREDLTIIVGINGAGKTSLLNIAGHLLGLGLTELAQIQFRKLVIVGVAKRKTFELTCVRTATKIARYLQRLNEQRSEIGFEIPESLQRTQESRDQRWMQDLNRPGFSGGSIL